MSIVFKVGMLTWLNAKLTPIKFAPLFIYAHINLKGKDDWSFVILVFVALREWGHVNPQNQSLFLLQC